MIIMGVDPGLGRTGYGIIKLKNGNPSFIKAGCIFTYGSLNDEKRLLLLARSFQNLIDLYNPDVIAIESLFFVNNIKTAVNVGQARGLIVYICAKCNKKVVNYGPLAVKLAVTGYGKADKRQVQLMVKSILKLDFLLKPDDAADAVAVALTHCFSRKLKDL